jgi:hypothetical protein
MSSKNARLVLVLSLGAWSSLALGQTHGAPPTVPELHFHIFPYGVESAVGVKLFKPWSEGPTVLLSAKVTPRAALARIARRFAEAPFRPDDETPEQLGQAMEEMDHSAANTEGWFDGPGFYTFAVQLGPRGRPAVATVAVTGAERRVDVWAWVGERGLRVLALVRVLPSDGRVALTRKWTPGSGATPRYEVVNRSDRAIYGTRTWGNFFGIVEKWDGTSWRWLARGGECGTVGAGAALRPGETTESDEGALMEHRPFSPGRYRYVLRYALMPLSFLDETSIFEMVARIGQTDHRQLETYQVEDVFEIAGDR